MSRSLKGTKTAVALPHRSESTQESIAGWCVFGSTVWLEFMVDVPNVLQEHTEVRGASSRGFLQRIGKNLSSEVQHRLSLNQMIIYLGLYSTYSDLNNDTFGVINHRAPSRSTYGCISVYDGRWISHCHTPLGRFTKLDCPTKTRAPIPKYASSETSRRDVSVADLYGADSIRTVEILTMERRTRGV